MPKDSRDDNHNVTSEDVSDYRYVRVGDFVVNKMKAWQGSVAVSNYEGIVSPAYFVYEFSDDLINKRYFLVIGEETNLNPKKLQIRVKMCQSAHENPKLKVI